MTSCPASDKLSSRHAKNVGFLIRHYDKLSDSSLSANPLRWNDGPRFRMTSCPNGVSGRTLLRLKKTLR